MNRRKIHFESCCGYTSCGTKITPQIMFTNIPTRVSCKLCADVVAGFRRSTRAPLKNESVLHDYIVPPECELTLGNGLIAHPGDMVVLKIKIERKRK